MKQKIITAVCLSGILAVLGGCAVSETSQSPAAEAVQESLVPAAESAPVQQEAASRDLFAMDTYMTLMAYGENGEAAIDAAAARIQELDALLSTGSETSEVSILNQNGGGTLSADGQTLLAASLRLSEETGGAFDPAMYPLMSLWGFPTQTYRVPTQEELDKALPLTDTSLIQFDSQTGAVSFSKEGMAIDLGGIAKGYTSQSIMEQFRAMGITSALVNLGGNVEALGAKPDGSAWNVAIRTPDESGGILGVISVIDEAVITSGGYERYFEEDGVTYHHILDPKTGRPADSGLASVTIVSPDGMLADALSTALFVMGYEDAVAFWDSGVETFEMVLVDNDGRVFATEGLTDRMRSDFEVTTINHSEKGR